jgi:hypothetical protein
VVGQVGDRSGASWAMPSPRTPGRRRGPASRRRAGLPAPARPTRCRLATPRGSRPGGGTPRRTRGCRRPWPPSRRFRPGPTRGRVRPRARRRRCRRRDP